MTARPPLYTTGKPSLCAKGGAHTAEPAGYLAWVEWADRLAETHEQTQCPACGLWAVWVPREARAAP